MPSVGDILRRPILLAGMRSTASSWTTKVLQEDRPSLPDQDRRHRSRRHHRRRRLRRSELGLTLVETIVSFAVLAIALAGTAQLLLAGSRMNHLAHRMAAASALAHDLLENMTLWDYDDPRLEPKETLTTADGEVAVTDFAFGREEQVEGDDKPHYGEQDDGIAQVPASLSSGSVPYRGVGLVDNETLPELSRYWNVYALDADGDGVEEGKVIMVGVRWYESGVGYRHVTASSFVANDRVMTQ